MQLNTPHLLKVVIKDINKAADPDSAEVFIGVSTGRNTTITILDWTPLTKEGEVYSLPINLTATVEVPVAAKVVARVARDGNYEEITDVMTINLK